MEGFFVAHRNFSGLEEKILTAVRVFVAPGNPHADAIKQFLLKKGYSLVENPSEADWVIKTENLEEIKVAYSRVFASKDIEVEGIFSRRYAAKAGFKLNPDASKVYEILLGLARNRKNYGFRYCPCRPLSGDRKEDAKKICPCFWHRQEIATMGHCHCGLFFRRAPDTS